MSIKLTTEEFINKCKMIHGEKFNYNNSEYKGALTKIEIICLNHGSFFQTPNAHLQGQGCPKCSKTKPLTQEDFIDNCKMIHNNKYNYDKVNYINNYNKITITCLIHGDFEQKASDHKRGFGCKKCSNKRNLCVI